MRPTILRTDAELNMCASVWEQLSPLANIVTAPDDRIETLTRLATRADLILTCYAPIHADVIHSASSLRGIVKYGVGVDSIDLDAASDRGIPVVHCPHYGTETVADQAFALMIAAARKVPLVDRDLRRATWLWPDHKYIGVDLADKTLGIIGFGRIGKAMVRRCQGFRMHPVVYDPYVDSKDVAAPVEFDALHNVIDRSDFLSLHAVLTPETRGMIGAAELQRMKRTAILVNVSRGDLVDETALAEALASGSIAGAGLDVFSREPLSSGHPLLSLDNVVLSPHFAFYSREAYERLEHTCWEAIEALLTGRTPKDVKNAEALRASSPPSPGEELDPRRTEGDINLSPQRQTWELDHLSHETRQLLDDDARFFMRQSLSTPCLNALAGCEGAYLQDVDGRKVLDFHGNSAHQVGYGHPRVISAIQNQLKELSFCPRRYTNRTSIELAERLAGLAPGGLNKVLFTPSGTAAIGIALKLARYSTGRHETISMHGSFHGASLDAISIGGEALFREALGPLLPGCHHVAWPRRADDAEAVEMLLSQRPVGAVIAEPMRCTTIEIPPPRYWQRVRDLCDHYGALLVFDEISLALGRTGKMFCCEHFSVEPDVLVIGKGLGGGILPMAAAIIREDLDRVPERSIGHYTHEKSPVGAAAALATLDVIQEQRLLKHAQELGAQSLARLKQMKTRHALIHDVRGLGLALGVELSRGGQDVIQEAERIMYDCLRGGLSFKVSGGNVLTLTPPLIISAEQMSEALGILESTL